uniref:NADH-ubiquinone oxidoreductase chain 4L n=1 Tax=Poecilocoris druraei TaxID=2080378 RepID=A0A2P1CMQ0_9HEMI|nr:NADH dehydrogenase subunit 4L [Poecilocoris druraei]AVJ52546.1 NADH dehydrogenase subunit 4L [Poecilocoris druraei]QXJ42690.1 NADH dehydrogenase subunit 4L [Poecilocoris druraei]UCC46100.1 NADH dehydrogenase subunit 4L [Poecilocoris druraei]
MSIFFLMIIPMVCGIITFCYSRNHLLLTLLSLEFMVLSVFYVMVLLMMLYGYELYYSLIFLVFSVCEGALGLSILVKMVRSQGNDYLLSMSILSW